MVIQVVRQRVDRLGFESIDSLCRALRVERLVLDAAIELCRSGYPYDSWQVPKKSGVGFREIEHPHVSLKTVQTKTNHLLQRVVIPDVFHGCLSRTSIKTNAEPHCFDSWFLGLDLADYYQTIRPGKVYDGLRSLGAAPDVARVITTLTTIRHHVPQGAPTSPIIAAIAMLKLAKRVSELVEGFGGSFTIFGDNLSMSAGRDLRRYKNTLIRIIKTEGFSVRTDKSVVCRPGVDKPLPGLVVRMARIVIADEDYDCVAQRVQTCRELGTQGISRRVCPRFRRRLEGMVNHYKWVDNEAMEEIATTFSLINWPHHYCRTACMGPSCHCL